MQKDELQKLLGITPKKTKELVKRFEKLSSAEKSKINQAVELTFNSCGIEGNSLSKNETFVICLYHHFSELDENKGLFMLQEELHEFGKMVFNDDEQMYKRWLSKKIIALGNVKPESLLNSAEGIEQVRNCLGRIEYGNMA